MTDLSKVPGKVIKWSEDMDEEVQKVLYPSTKLPKRVDFNLATRVLLEVQDMAWEEEPEEVQCVCGQYGLPNAHDGYYFCGGSPRCCP